MDVEPLRQFAMVPSCRSAAIATFALNAGEWFRRSRLDMVASCKSPYGPELSLSGPENLSK